MPILMFNIQKCRVLIKNFIMFFRVIILRIGI